MKMAFSPAQSFKFKSPEVKEEQRQAVEVIKTQLLTDQLVAEMANVIVTKFFVFRQIDLEAWEEDEDEWEIREEGGGDTWEFEIRPCAEKLFMDLVLNFKQLLTEPLLFFFRSVAGPSQSSVVRTMGRATPPTKFVIRLYLRRQREISTLWFNFTPLFENQTNILRIIGSFRKIFPDEDIC